MVYLYEIAQLYELPSRNKLRSLNQLVTVTVALDASSCGAAAQIALRRGVVSSWTIQLALFKRPRIQALISFAFFPKPSGRQSLLQRAIMLQGVGPLLGLQAGLLKR